MAAQRGQDGGNAFVHTRADSDSYLDALFDHLVNPTAPKTLPMRHRNLPDGFFSQQAASRGAGPLSASGQHSRENSTDSGYGQTGGAAQVSALATAHPRSQSLPASFPVGSQIQRNAGSIGRSLYLPGHRIVDEDDGQGALPNGWSMAVTAGGQKYFIDHASKRTMWEDPRVVLPKEEEEPLPDGWQKAFTEDGTPYFINHHDRTTTWTRPTSTSSQTVASVRQPPPPALHQTLLLPSQQQNHHARSQSLQRNQKLRIQRLQQEREMLRLQREREVLLRQHQALLQKEIKLKQLVDDLGGVPVHQRDPMMSSVASVTGPGLTYHSRESSADYGMETVAIAGPTSSTFLPQPPVHNESGLLDTFGEMGIGDGTGHGDDGVMMVPMSGISPALAATVGGTSAMQYSVATAHPSSGMLSDILDSMEGTSVDETPNMSVPTSHPMDTDDDVAPDFLSEVQSLLSNAAEHPLFASDNFS